MKGETIYELLEHIRRRPGMYLQGVSLESLRNFLAGYSVGVRRDFAPGELHLDMPGAASHGWFGAIHLEEPDGLKAFERFFTYLDDYRARRLAAAIEIQLTAAQRRRYVENDWEVTLATRRDLEALGVSYEKPPVRRRFTPPRWLRLSRDGGHISPKAYPRQMSATKRDWPLPSRLSKNRTGASLPVRKTARPFPAGLLRMIRLSEFSRCWCEPGLSSPCRPCRRRPEAWRGPSPSRAARSPRLPW